MFCTLIIVTAFFPTILTQLQEVNTRIIGGKSCSILDYPFYIDIQKKTNYTDYHTHCGGTLLNERWVLSAAHCFEDFKKPNIYRFVAGLQLAGNMKGDFITGYKYSYAKSVYIHPEFNLTTLKNDIGLVQLENPFLRDSIIDYVQFAKPNGSFNPLCSVGTLLGFGSQTIQDNDGNPLEKTVDRKPDLQCIHLPIASEETCLKQGFGPKYANPNYTLCTMVPSKEKTVDACIGDSGGPILCDGVQVGIISHGYGCGLSKHARFYMKVDMYYDFINEIMTKYDETKIKNNSIKIEVSMTLEKKFPHAQNNFPESSQQIKGKETYPIEIEAMFIETIPAALNDEYSSVVENFSALDTEESASTPMQPISLKNKPSFSYELIKNIMSMKTEKHCEKSNQILKDDKINFPGFVKPIVFIPTQNEMNWKKSKLISIDNNHGPPETIPISKRKTSIFIPEKFSSRSINNIPGSMRRFLTMPHNMPKPKPIMFRRISPFIWKKRNPQKQMILMPLI